MGADGAAVDPSARIKKAPMPSVMYAIQPPIEPTGVEKRFSGEHQGSAED